MIVMLDTSHDLQQCEREVKRPVEQLLTPLTRFNNRAPDQHFAIDNGSFSKFDRQAFESLLEREKPRQKLCRFVAIPDVIAKGVGNARRTLEVFDYWREILADKQGWKVALVAQDGQEDLPIPWGLIDAIFIGGSTHWKDSIHADHIVKTAKAIGVWVHIGRVNDAKRFARFEELGADSCDGSGISQYSWQREALTVAPHPTLFESEQHRADFLLEFANK